MSDLKAQIEELWSGRDDLDVDDTEANAAIHAAIDLLDTGQARDRKSTRLNSSHALISYAVFCLKKKKRNKKKKKKKKEKKTNRE